jgi:hypothetical protein
MYNVTKAAYVYVSYVYARTIETNDYQAFVLIALVISAIARSF